MSFSSGFKSGVGDVTVEAFVDGNAVAVRREDGTLRIMLPADSERHSIDLRVWIDESPSDWFPLIRPRLMAPYGAGRVYWQVVTPLDSHALWASPTLGRAMNWNLQDWSLARKPVRSDQMLATWAGVSSTLAMPLGNRYLYVGTEPSSFRAVTASRGQLWSLVAAFVLGVAMLLTYVPRSRSPMIAVAGALLLTGLIAVAPDAAVLAGQLAMIALVLVVVMTSIRALISPRKTRRVFQSGQWVKADSSTRTIKPRSPKREPAKRDHPKPDHVKQDQFAQGGRASVQGATDTESMPHAGRPTDDASKGDAVSSGSAELPPTTEVSP